MPISHVSEQTSSIIRCQRKIRRGSIFGKKVLSGIFFEAVLFGVFMSKESIHKKFSCRKRKNIFTLSWQEKGIKSETSDHIQKGRRNEKGGEHRSDLHVETDELDSATHLEERDLEAKLDFWSVSGNFISCHHAQEREKYKSASGMLVSNLPLKVLDVVRRTSTTLDVFATVSNFMIAGLLTVLGSCQGHGLDSPSAPC